MDVHGFLASVCCLCCMHMNHWRLILERESLSLLHHAVSQAHHNCASYFHFSSELEPHFKQLVMEGARLSRVR